ncbi:hypothetical protein ABPG74_003658 [Tetrahymena malaccensis]
MPCNIIGCQKCASQDKCELCYDGYDLINGICISVCNQDYKYLEQQESSCSYLCGLGESINNQVSICQQINKCPIYQSTSNYCHTYDVIVQQTILSMDTYIDVNNQEVLITYDNLGSIKFWKYQSPIINFLSEVPPTLQDRDNTLIQVWTDLNGQTYRGELYIEDTKVCQLKNAYGQLIRATSNVYILLGNANYGIFIVDQNFTSDCQEFMIPNLDQKNYYPSIVSSEQFLIIVLKTNNMFLCSQNYKLYQILENQQSQTQLIEGNLFQQIQDFQQMCLQNQIILGNTLIIQIANQLNVLYKIDLKTFTKSQYYFYESFYSIFIVDNQIVLTLDENNFGSVILTDDQNYLFEKNTVCKSQMLPNFTYGFVAFNMLDTLQKKYQLDGFSSNILLRDMRNGNIIFNLKNTYSPTFNLFKNKIYNFQFGAIVVVDLQKDPENEEEFINQIILPLANRNGIFFQDNEQNLYIYNFDGNKNKSIVSYNISGQFIAQFLGRQDLNYNLRQKYFDQNKKIICLVDHINLVLSFFDFQNLKQYDIVLTQFQQNSQIQNILYSNQLDTQTIIFFTQNYAFKVNFLGQILSQVQLVYQPVSYNALPDKKLIILLCKDQIQFIDQNLNLLSNSFSTYGSLLYQVTLGGKIIIVSYDSYKVQIINFDNMQEMVLVLFFQVPQIIPYQDGIHFGIFQLRNLVVYSIYQNQVIQSFQIQLPTNECQQKVVDIFKFNYANQLFLYDSQDTSGFCSIVGNNGYQSTQIQLKIPGQVYLNVVSYHDNNYTHLGSYFDSSSQTIYMLLQNSQNIAFLCSSSYSNIQTINVIVQIDQQQLNNFQQIIGNSEYQIIYFDNGFIIYKNQSLFFMRDDIQPQIQQFIIDIQEDIILIANSNCLWYVFQFSTKTLLYTMPQDYQFQPSQQCTHSFDKKNKNILLKQISQIASYAYRNQSLNWFITTNDLGNSQMVGLYAIESQNQFFLVTNPCIAVVYNEPDFIIYDYYRLIFSQLTFVKYFYDNYNQRIILCSSEFQQCQIYTEQFTLIKTLLFQDAFDINQLQYYQNPINALIAVNSKLLIQIMYLDDSYQTNQQYLKSINIQQYSQIFQSYNFPTIFFIIEDFEKDLLTIAFNDSIFFIQISSGLIIHYLDYNNHLSKTKQNGYILYLYLDKQRNILLCMTKENFIVYDYQSITFYNSQNFYMSINNADAVGYIEDSTQNNQITIFVRNFFYNNLVFYKANLQDQTIQPFKLLDMIQDANFKFPYFSGPQQKDLDVNNNIQYNYKTYSIQSKEGYYLITQYHLLRYNIYQITNTNITCVRKFFFVSNNYNFYNFIQESPYFPILILQNSNEQQLYIQVIDQISPIQQIKSQAFSQKINSCDIRKQIIYCFSSVGNYVIQINLSNPQQFNITTLNNLDNSLQNQQLTFCSRLQNTISQFPLIFYFNKTIYSWNVTSQVIYKIMNEDDIKSVSIGNYYILVEFYSQIDFQIFPFDLNGKLQISAYKIQLPAQRQNDLSSNNQIPLFYNSKREQTQISQNNQYLVLRTYGQANIYNLIDFSLYLVIRSSNITSIQNINIIFKSVLLLTTSNSIDLYQFSKNSYKLLYSFQIIKPVIGFSSFKPIQQSNQYELNLIISSNYEVSLLQQIVILDQQGGQSNNQDQLQCIKTITNYQQDLSVLNYSKEMQLNYEYFYQKGYSSIQVIQIHFYPFTNLYFMEDFFQTLQQKSFVLRLYSDSQQSQVYLINQNFDNINNVFVPSINNLEIVNMMISIPIYSPIKQQIQLPLILNINDKNMLQRFSMLNSKIDLDQKVLFKFQNLNELTLSNIILEFSDHFPQINCTQNDQIILMKDISSIKINNLTISKISLQQNPLIKTLFQFENIINIIIENISILESDINAQTIFNFYNISTIKVNNIVVNQSKSSGSLYNISLVNQLQLTNLQIISTQFRGIYNQFILLHYGVTEIVIKNITVLSSSCPSIILVQEQIFIGIIFATNYIAINYLNITQNKLNSQYTSSILLSSFSTTLDELYFNYNSVQNEAITLLTNQLNFTNVSINDNKVNNILIHLESYKLGNLQSQYQQIYFSNGLIENNILIKGQVLYILNSINILFDFFQIYNNKLQESYQGTLTFEQSQNITINDSNIIKNVVLKGCGGGLYILESQVILSNCIISDNQAVIGGGIRYQGLSSSLIYSNNSYSTDQHIFKKSTIQNNSALLFGKDVTSYPTKFQFQKDYSEILNNLISGSMLKEPIQFNLVDEFDEIVVYPINYNSSQVDQKILIEFESYSIQIQYENLKQDLNIQGSIQIQTKIISFQPTFTSVPQTKQSFQMQLLSQVPVYNQKSNNFTLTTIQKEFKISFLPCSVGQIPKQQLNLIQCYSCPLGTYSFTQHFSNATDSQCNGCPSQAVYCEKNTILLKNGFWRPSPDDDRIFSCSNQQNCIQQTNQDQYNITSQMNKQLFEKSICLEGHLGPLCESCDINQELWDERFAQDQNFKCTKCKDSFKNYFLTIFLISFQFVYIAYSFNKISTSNTKKCLLYYIKQLRLLCVGKSLLADENAIQTKILINYIQIIQVIFQIANYSSYLKNSVTIFGDPSSISVMSIDCLIIDERINLGSILTRRAFVRLTIPLIFMSVLCYYIFKAKAKNQTPIILLYDLKCSLIFLWLFFSPSIINYLILQISCTQIGNYSYVTTDKQFLCYGDDHMQVILYIIIPSLLLLYIFFPIFFFMKINKKEKYYWEIVKTSQKSLIFLNNLFENTSQKALISILILSIYYILSKKNQPYINKNLNNVDLIATILQILCITLSTYLNFVISTAWETLIVIFVFTMNITFITYNLSKIIVIKIPSEITQRQWYHKLLIKYKQKLPYYLTSNIIILSALQFKAQRKWVLIQKKVRYLIKQNRLRLLQELAQKSKEMRRQSSNQKLKKSLISPLKQSSFFSKNIFQPNKVNQKRNTQDISTNSIFQDISYQRSKLINTTNQQCNENDSFIFSKNLTLTKTISSAFTKKKTVQN